MACSIRTSAVLVTKNIWEAIELSYSDLPGDDERRNNKKALFLLVEGQFLNDDKNKSDGRKVSSHKPGELLTIRRKG
ncbi:hypothetical protein CDAR_239641 [Caerostris darwini]|uniref:Uncharacterized protein n=1 Tax=Caerostris darwini TaxID=1538125 RepID=A0AAV4SP06_9ARAC|nr:hypothetical protein CDAR_239641 [Caerostris darwini]